jgi:uncharacterized Fe-S cluster-containing MiaB family protein
MSPSSRPYYPEPFDEPVPGGSPPALHNLVYCSRATGTVDAAELARIIQTAQRHNPAHGITGLLVYGSGVFFQWLEGPRDEVLRLMTRLRADPRHEAVVLLSETEEVRDRLFPIWDMELVEASDIREVLQDALSQAIQPQQAQALQSMLKLLDAGPISALGTA